MLQDVDFVNVENTLFIKLIFKPCTPRKVAQNVAEEYKREVCGRLKDKFDHTFVIPCFRNTTDVNINVTDDGSKSALDVKKQLEDIINMTIERAT